MRQWIAPCHTKEQLNTLKKSVFPELAESEDEKIWQWIREHINHDGTNMFDKAVTWLEKQKEQKPNIELIQRSWYMEGYHDREFGKEPKWIIKTGEGGPKHELNPKYGLPLADEQKPAENYLEWRNIVYYVLKEWLGIGQYMDMAPFNNIVKTLQERYSLPKPAEWNEEDEKMLNEIIHDVVELKNAKSINGLKCKIDWLKSLRPSWKPSEEDINAIGLAIANLNPMGHLTLCGELNSLKHELLKLK